MNATDVILCGLVWAQFRVRTAGLELVRALESADPELQSLAEVMLEQAGVCSRELVRDAIARDDDASVEQSLHSFRPTDGAPKYSEFWWLPPSSD